MNRRTSKSSLWSRRPTWGVVRVMAAVAATLAVVGASPGYASPGKPQGGASSPHTGAAADGHRSSPMRELDFLLGSYRCDYTDLISDPPVTSTVTWSTHRILGGDYYEMRLRGHQFRGRWEFGWNPVDERFVTFYFDDQGISGTSGSAGFVDGTLTFVGPYTAFGQHLLSQDEFTVVDRRHFVDDASINPDGTWLPLSHIECERR